MAIAGNDTCDEFSRSYSALSIEAAWRLSSDVQKAENLYALLARCDYVSLHVTAIQPLCIKAVTVLPLPPATG
jgi:hypothetical protein